MLRLTRWIKNLQLRKQKYSVICLLSKGKIDLEKEAYKNSTNDLQKVIRFVGIGINKTPFGKICYLLGQGRVMCAAHGG